MTELEKNNLKVNIEVSVEKKQQKEHLLVGNIAQHEGHTMWEINKETLEIKPAKFSNATYKMFGQNKKEIIVKEGYAYVSALTKKNALKKYKNGTDGGKQIGAMKLPY